MGNRIQVLFFCLLGNAVRFSFSCPLIICANWNLLLESEWRKHRFTYKVEVSSWNLFWEQCFRKSAWFIFFSYHCSVFSIFPAEKAVCTLNLEWGTPGDEWWDLSCLAMPESHSACRQGAVVDVWQRDVSCMSSSIFIMWLLLDHSLCNRDTPW